MNDVVAVESRKSPRSLIISPNLEALLEHEDRIRQLTDDAGVAQVEVAASPLTEVEEETEGLPPPPRKARRTRGTMRLGSPQCGSFSGMEQLHGMRKSVSLPSSPAMPTGPTTPNPYINPAPTLDEILGAERGVATGTGARGNRTTKYGVLRSDGGWTDDQENEDDGDEHDDRSWTATRPRDDTLLTTLPRRSIDTDGRQMGSGEEGGERKHKLRESVYKGGSIPRIEKLFGINRNPFGRLNGATQVFRIEQDITETKAASPKSPTEPFSEKTRSNSPMNSTEMQWGIRESVVLDIRRQSEGGVEGEWVERLSGSSGDRDGVPRRVRDSHGGRSSGCWSGSGSGETETETRSTGRHISISSTRYDHSLLDHPPSMFQHDDRHSFIDILSPTRPDFSPPPDRPKLAVDTNSPAPSHKPPIPTTPKPIFTRRPGGSRRSSPKEASPSPARSGSAGNSPLPPTTNYLDMGERAELIRKSRKLTQVFGQTPGPDALSQQDCARPSAVHARNRHHRTVMSLSNEASKPVLPPLRPATFDRISGRRYSLPVSPDDMSFLNVSPPPTDSHSSTFERQQSRHAVPDSSSRTSFIDLSDDEDGASVLLTPIPGVPRDISPSTQSLFENMPPEEQAEILRRRKREKLAKLHRFLGSRVPPQLVLGTDSSDSPLPPIRSPLDPPMSPEDSARRIWLRRRRSSSAAVFPSTWSDDLDRVKADLSDTEKAINVRRAQKMEKVFGVAPPQSLYHTRHSPSPSASKAVSGVTNTNTNTNTMQDVLGPSIQRNPNKSSYTNKTRSKKNDRPGTAESSQALIPKNRQSATDVDTRPTQHSFIYNHYQHSLNSLNDIIDRDDRESLAELHQYLSGGEIPSPAETRSPADRRVSNASIKSERRRSLPARTSMLSIASEFSITSPKPEITDFQIRRRRVAKLTQFFGVDYRELINDVLESIENGLEHERKRGTLRAEEVEDLLERLRALRVKREGVF